MENNQLSPVVVIKQKELELAERLAAAKQAAEGSILEARQWATDLRDKAEREGHEKAAVFYRAELEACDAQAEKVRDEGELSARWISERGSRGLEQAVQCILETILPAFPPAVVRPGTFESHDSQDLTKTQTIAWKVRGGGEE